MHTTNTKEKILTVALRLFARDGYEAVSVSALAGALGMTKGALYRHYKSKRDLFDSMIARMLKLDSSAARQYGMPVDNRSFKKLDISGVEAPALSVKVKGTVTTKAQA